MSPPPAPAGITGPAAELEFTSTPEDLTALEASTLEQQLIQQDHRPLLDSNDESNTAPMTSDVIASFALPTTDSPSSPCYRKRMRDLKEEVPLLPSAVEYPVKRVKAVSWSEEVQDMLATTRALENNSSISQSGPDADVSIEEILQPLAETALAATEFEQLIEADTLARIPVPEIEAVQLRSP